MNKDNVERQAAEFQERMQVLDAKYLEFKTWINSFNGRCRVDMANGLVLRRGRDGFGIYRASGSAWIEFIHFSVEQKIEALEILPRIIEVMSQKQRDLVDRVNKL
jgi:hypothetical protein